MSRLGFAETLPLLVIDQGRPSDIEIRTAINVANQFLHGREHRLGHPRVHDYLRNGAQLDVELLCFHLLLLILVDDPKLLLVTKLVAFQERQVVYVRP